MVKVVASFSFRDCPVNSRDFDLVVDARRFRNPHRLKNLRYLTGLDEAVRNDVLRSPGVRGLIDQIVTSNSETVAIGCFGGRHRSVVIAEEVARLTGAQVWHMNKAKWRTK